MNRKLEKIFNDIAMQLPMDEQESLSEIGLDSMKFLQLIVYLENEFSITIPDKCLLLENFNSVEQINRTIEWLTQGTVSS